jgi:hypothetical protein
MINLSEDGMRDEIYDLLEACTNEELTPVVEALTNARASILKISRTFERYSPNHTQYTDQIGDEIHRLSLVALGRNDRVRPSYSDLVMALCKKFSIPFTKDNIKNNENNLINLFSKQHLATVAPSDQQGALNDVQKAASNAAGGLLSSDAWPPLAASFMQIAYLRQKLVAEGRIQTPGPESTLAPVSSSSSTEENSRTLVVRTEDGNSVFSLESISLPADIDKDWKHVRGTEKSITAISPILQAVQPLISAEQMLARGNYFRVTIPPGAKILWSEQHKSLIGAAHDTNNQFTKVLLDPANAIKLASPVMFLTLATAMMEQKKFDDINRSLSEVKTAIADVSKFQKDERRSVLTGSIRYFEQVAPSISAGELSDEVLHVIERHEVDLVRIQDHLVEEIRTQIEALQSIKDEEWFGSGKFAKAIEEQQNALEKIYNEMFLCLRLRACGWQLLCAYPGRELGKEARFKDIVKALDTFGPRGETTITVDKVLREKVLKISANDSKLLVLINEEALFNKIHQNCKKVRSDMQTVEGGFAELEKPVSMDLRIEDGQITAMRRL